MLHWDPNGKIGPKRLLPNNVSVVEPKEKKVDLRRHLEEKLDTIMEVVL